LSETKAVPVYAGAAFAASIHNRMSPVMAKVLFTLIVTLGLVGAFAWIPSNASTHHDVLVADHRVDYSDLDISTYAGADRLLRRMRLAAQIGCDARADFAAITLRSTNPLCSRDALALAVAGLDSSKVNARYVRETPTMAS
jgi:UrcA family protein